MLCSLIPLSVRYGLSLVFHLTAFSLLFSFHHPCLAVCLFWVSLATVCLSLLYCLSPVELLGITYHNATGGSQSFSSAPNLSSLPLSNGSASLSSSSTGLSFCQFNVFQFKANMAKSEFFIFRRKPFPVHDVFCDYQHSQSQLCLLLGDIFLSCTFRVAYNLLLLLFICIVIILIHFPLMYF